MVSGIYGFMVSGDHVSMESMISVESTGCVDARGCVKAIPSDAWSQWAKLLGKPRKKPAARLTYFAIRVYLSGRCVEKRFLKAP